VNCLHNTLMISVSALKTLQAMTNTTFQQLLHQWCTTLHLRGTYEEERWLHEVSLAINSQLRIKYARR